MQRLGARSLLLAYLLSSSTTTTTTAYPSPASTDIDTSAFTCLAGDYDQAESCRVACGEGQGLGRCTPINADSNSARDLDVVGDGSRPSLRCECAS